MGQPEDEEQQQQQQQSDLTTSKDGGGEGGGGGGDGSGEPLLGSNQQDEQGASTSNNTNTNTGDGHSDGGGDGSDDKRQIKDSTSDNNMEGNTDNENENKTNNGSSGRSGGGGDDGSNDKDNRQQQQQQQLEQQHNNKYRKKTNDDSTNSTTNKDYTHSNGVKGGNDGLKKRIVGKQVSDPNAPISPEEMEQFIPEPPDGGWGWVIVFASIINNLIVDGLCYTFGVFLEEFMSEFNATSTKVSLVGSLTCGVYLFAGPIVSAMTNRFGCRRVVISGSLIATLAFVLATRAPNVDILILTYGFMGGFGLGMIYLPSIVSVGYYFQARRAFATGLAVAGSGLGTFIFPPMCEMLLSNYSWRGALLIIAGIVFNACVSGSLMRPLEAKPPKAKKNTGGAIANGGQPRKKRTWDRIQQYFRKRSQSEATYNEDQAIVDKVREAKLIREKKLQETDSVLGSVPSVTFKRIDSTSTSDGKILREAQKKMMAAANEGQNNGPDTNTNTTTPTPGEAPPPESPKIIIELENEHGSKISEDIIILDGPKSPDTKDGKDEVVHIRTANKRGSETAPLLSVPSASSGGTGNVLPAGCGGSRSNLYHISSMRSIHVSKKDLAKDLARPLYRKDIFYSASVLNIPQYQSQQDVKSYITSITTLPGERDFLDGPPACTKCINSCCTCLPRSARDVLSEMVDLSLFKDTSFMLICLGNFLAFLGFFVPFVFMVDKAVDAGIPKADAAFLISIIGITNTVGRVVTGKLVDHKILDSLVVSYTAIALCGVVTALTPFCNTYWLLAINAALFGTGMAAFVSLSSIIICDRMGVEKLTNAFGLMSMTRGISGMVGPPLGGQLYEMTSNYNLSFFVAGFFLVAGAVCHMFLHLPCLRPPKPALIPDDCDVIMEEMEGGDPEHQQQQQQRTAHASSPSSSGAGGVHEMMMAEGGKEQPHIITVDEISMEDRKNV